MTVIYFSSEVATRNNIRTYSGGLGVLAGDTAKTAADKGVDFAGVTMLYPLGYATQNGEPQDWIPKENGVLKPEKVGLVPLEERVQVQFEGRTLNIGAWREDVKSEESGYSVPLFRLTTDVEGNTEQDRRITDRLYDKSNELAQYVVLGIGGKLLLERLGIKADTCHMNEGHSSLLTLAQLLEAGGDEKKVAVQNIFFNHSVVADAMPKVWWNSLKSAVGKQYPNIDSLIPKRILDYALCGGFLETNRLAAKLSRGPEGISEKGGMYAVSEQHEGVLRGMFPGIPVGHVTNGVHAPTWVTPQIAALYDKHIGKEWRTNPEALRKAASISPSDFWNAHMAGKIEGMRKLYDRLDVLLNPLAFTIGFARRAATYKDWELLLNETNCHLLENLDQPIQYVVAGKPHPADLEAKCMVDRVKAVGAKLNRVVKFLFIDEYDMDLARILFEIVDVWANHPWKMWEACGTSGMKATLNGIPNLSKLEGWYYEAVMKGIVEPDVTGWVISEQSPHLSFISGIKAMQKAHYRGDMAKIMPKIVSQVGPYVHSVRMFQQYRDEIWSQQKVAVPV